MIFFLSITGEVQTDINLITTNETGYVCYSSFELKQKIKDALDNGNLDYQTKKRISDLNEQIAENDNPILIVGRLK